MDNKVLLILCLIVLNPADAMFNRESPVLWRKIDDPVITDVIEVTQDVLWVDPCYVLNNVTVNPESLDFVSDWCHDLWSSHFINPLRAFCPAKTLRHNKTIHLIRDPVKLVRNKRIPFVLPLAIPALSLIKTAFMTVVGQFGISFGAYSLVEHSNSKDFQEQALKEMEQRRQEHEKIGTQMNLMAAEQIIFNARLTRLENRFDTFIKSYPITSTLVAGIAAKMAYVKPELERIATLWKNDRVDPGIFSLFEIPLDPNADVSRAVPLSCEMDEVKRIVSLKFRLPVKDPNSVIMKADPFTL
jgi:hypothetical protein